MQTMDFLTAMLFGWGKVTCNCAKRIMFGRLLIMDQSKTLVRALLYGTVWLDEPSPFVVSEVANTYKSNIDNLTVQYPGD